MTRQLVDLPIGKVHPHPHNYRAGLADVDQLAASIRAVGLIQPIVVRPHPDKPGEYQLVAGHRRHAAASKAGLKKITAEVREDLDDGMAYAAMLVENLQRQELTVLEEAAGYRILVDLGWRQKDIAEKTGRSPAVVSKRLRLLDLPDDILPAVRDGRIGVETAYEVARAIGDRDVDSAQLVANVVEILTDPDDLTSDFQFDSDVLWAATTATRRAEASRVEAKIVRELTDAGAVQLSDDERSSGRPIEGWNGLDVDYDAHLTEPCSRWRLTWRGKDSGPEWWCAVPSRHFPDGESTVKVTDDWWAEHDPDRHTATSESPFDRNQRQREARRVERATFYKTLMAADPYTWPVTVDLVYQQAIALALHQEMHMTGETLHMALDLLADVTGQSTPKSAPVSRMRDRLIEHFASHTHQTAMAIVLAAGEGWRLDQNDKSVARDFVQLLGLDQWDDDQQTIDTGDAA